MTFDPQTTHCLSKAARSALYHRLAFCLDVLDALPESPVGPCLFQLDGGRPQAVPCETNRTTIGRSPEADLTIEDPKMSRLHASIVCHGEDYILVDHSSRNGTWVNEQSITHRILLSGDQIVIGLSRFVFL